MARNVSLNPIFRVPEAKFEYYFSWNQINVNHTQLRPHRHVVLFSVMKKEDFVCQKHHLLTEKLYQKPKYKKKLQPLSFSELDVILKP
jgi:hypothetical protein